MQMLRRAPEVSFGVHLTLTRDSPAQRWRPVARREDVPSLVDEEGLLFTSAASPKLLAQAHPQDVEREFTAQIDAAARSRLTPTHLDWHALADGGRPDIFDLTVTLARHHGLAVRVWLERGQRLTRASGLPVIDHPFVDSFALGVAGKADRYVKMLRALPPGLSEWAVHPARLDRAAPGQDLGWAVRRSDHAFLTSPLARRVVDEERIVIISSRDLQDRWSTRPAAPAD